MGKRLRRKQDFLYTDEELWELYQGFAEERYYARLAKLSGFMALPDNRLAKEKLKEFEERYEEWQREKSGNRSGSLAQSPTCAGRGALE